MNAAMRDPRPLVRARKALANVRTIDRNERLGLYTGRNCEAVEAGRRAYLREFETASNDLDRRIVGLVWGEHRDAERVSRAKDDGQDRPELRDRLNRTRRTLREALA